MLDAESETVLIEMMKYGVFKDASEIVNKAVKSYHRKHPRTEHQAGDPTKNPAYKLLDDLPDEVWKVIPQYPGYEASSLGRVRSTKFLKRKMLSLTPAERGYKLVTLTRNGETYRPLVHCLVADAFLPEDESKSDVNHRDGNHSNNALFNLERLSRRENLAHSSATGLHARGIRHWKNKLSPQAITEIINLKDSGQTRSEVASRFGVSSSHVSNIWRGKNWRHFNPE